MRQKIEEMAKTIVEKNKKISAIQEKYDRQVVRTKELEKELEEARRGKVEKTMVTEVRESPLKEEKSREKKPKHASNLQSDDYDFWNADPADVTPNLKLRT
jgi:uncharacterized coiled-coil DUF342 family protein